MTRRSPRTVLESLRSLYSWHRWLGLTAAAFVILFALTGLALNHSASLGLDRSYLRQEIWRYLYDLNETPTVLGLPLDGHWLSQTDGRLYFDDRFVTQAGIPQDAAAYGNETWVIAYPAELLLVDSTGRLLERLDASQLPGRISAIRQTKEGLRLRTPYAVFEGDLQSLNWRPVADRHDWPTRETRTPPAKLASRIRQDAMAHQISWERLLLDLHSGRLFGLAGVVLMDAAGVLLLMLAVSGPWLWLHLRRRLKRRRERLRKD